MRSLARFCIISLCLLLLVGSFSFCSASSLFDGLIESEATPAPTEAPASIADTADSSAGTLEARLTDLSALLGTPTITVIDDEIRSVVYADVDYEALVEAMPLIPTEGLVEVSYLFTRQTLTLLYRDSSANQTEPVQTPAPTATKAPAADGECSHCYGSGTCMECIFGECEFCFGEGSVSCDTCFGSADCDRCYGMGGEYRMVIGGDDRWVSCSRCGGSGSCRSCRGTGYEKCTYCSGTGKCTVCKGSERCKYCSGTGKSQ